MKKQLLISLSILIVSLTAWDVSAQTVYKSSGGKSNKKSKSGAKFDKEKLVLGGNFGFYGQQIDQNTTFSFFQITPMVGYELTSFINAGVSFGYQYSRYKYNPYYNFVTGEEYLYKVKTPTTYFGIWDQIFIIPQLFLSTELLYTVFKYPVPNYTTGEYDLLRGSAPSFLVGAGYANRSGPESKLYYAVWINYDVIQDPNSPYYSGNDLIAGLFYKAGFFLRL